jgi:TolB-like protein/tetratricopeptide (TPR) repeat protein
VPEPVSSSPPSAVFLSYAREDSDTARRLAEALRGFGVEAWFDQSELRGGDAWDQKIRRQIKDCALFVPIISAHTQARGEGYFRLEWKLAAERTHLMAEGVPFLAPVVIDDTPDASAAVPAEFLRVQWTRLPSGAPTPEFVAQVKRLLAAPRTAAPAMRAPTAAAATPASAAPTKAAGFPGWTWGALIAVVVGAAAAVYVARKPAPAPVEAPKSAAETKAASASTPAAAAPAATAPDPKSVAVLAFANLSADKDNEYFSDGLSENILDKLARVPGLHVMARTSSFSYKGKNVPVQQIAAELHVGTVIEGSVQRAGNKLRVVAQLINATDGMHLWSETYDRELTTTDIFALQDEIALKIAAKLAPNSIAVTPVTTSIAAAPTKNLEAYETYLRGREQQVTSVAPFYQLKAAEFLEKATQLDPTFALAWVQLARVRSGLHYIGGVDDEDRELVLARVAIDQAQRLQPDLPAIHLALACLRVYGEHDYSSARRELDLLARSQPDDADTCQLRGLIARNLVQFSVAIEFFQRGLALDPKNSTSLNSFGLALMSTSRYAEAESVLTRAAQIDQSGLPLSNRARVLLRWKGDAKLAFASLEQVRIDRLTGASFKNVVWFARAAGENAKALEHVRQANWSVVLGQWEYVIRDLLSAQTREAMGDSEGARRDYLAALPIAERTRDAHQGSQRAYVTLSQVYAGLGRREDALAAVRKSLELMPPAQDPFATSFVSLRVLVNIQGQFGLIDEALEIVRQQIAAGLWVRNDLLLNPDFFHLQKDPRFRALAEKAPL